MKKIYFLFISLFLVLGFSMINVGALEAGELELKLECPSSMKKNETVDCKLVGNIKNEALTSLVLDIDYDDTFISTSVSNISLTSINYEAGDNVYIGDGFKVTAKDIVQDVTIALKNIVAQGENESSFIVNSPVSTNIRIANDESRLEYFLIDKTQIKIEDGTSISHSVNTSKIVLDAKKIDTKQTITGLGEKSLACGSNQFNVISYAEDKSTTNYTLSITRTCNSDASLKGITLSKGSLSPVFDEDTLTYRVNVSKEVSSITITANKKDNVQRVSGEVKNKALNFGDNTIKLVVYAEDNTKKEYKIIVNREDTRSSNASLSSLNISDGKISFDEDILTYDTKVLYETTNIKVNATAYDELSKIKISGGKNLVVGQNKIEIKVTAENGTEKIYVINVNRLKKGETLGDNPKISSLTIEGYGLVFDSEKFEYTLEIKDEDALSINIIMEDESSLFNISGNSGLKDGSVITINTRSLDGNSLEYKINIVKNDDFLVYLIGIASIVIAVITITIILICAKKGKKKKFNEDKNLINKIEKQLNKANIEQELTLEQKEMKEYETFKAPPLDKKLEVEIIDDVDEEVIAKKDINEEQNKVQEEKIENTNIYNSNFFARARIEEQLGDTLIGEDAKKVQEELKPINDVFNMARVKKEEIETINEEVKEVKPSYSGTTKICKICGHRIPTELKECPYCKRKF